MNSILFLGGTGVGKSSLINFLADKEIAKSGITSSVGGITRGFHDYTNISLGNNKFNLIDSEGYELNKEQNWINMIRPKIDLGSRFAGSWIETFVFCVDASKGRIQAFEESVIKDIVKISIHALLH